MASTQLIEWNYLYYCFLSSGPNLCATEAAGEVLQGVKLKKDATSLNLPERKNEIIKGLQGVLEHRFSDAHTDLVKGSIITNLKAWPLQDERRGKTTFKYQIRYHARCVFYF